MMKDLLRAQRSSTKNSEEIDFCSKFPFPRMNKTAIILEELDYDFGDFVVHNDNL